MILMARRLMMTEAVMADRFDLEAAVQDSLPKIPEVGTVLKETGNYRLEIGRLTLAAEHLTGCFGYILRNKNTWVVEQVGTSLPQAIYNMYHNENALQQALAVDPQAFQAGGQSLDELLGIESDGTPRLPGPEDQ